MISAFPNIVFGFHGCDRAIGEKVISGQRQLMVSRNSYDWLGSGIYFWENAPHRALDWARACVDNPRLTKGTIQHPFVLGAIIDLGQCLNLTDVAHMEILRATYTHLKTTFDLVSAELPCNSDKNHQLDCLVINTAITLSRQNGNGDFDTVRGAYIEGKPAYPGAKIYEQTHIQICVRNPKNILGYFAPVLD